MRNTFMEIYYNNSLNNTNSLYSYFTFWFGCCWFGCFWCSSGSCCCSRFFSSSSSSSSCRLSCSGGSGCCCGGWLGCFMNIKYHLVHV